MFFNKSLLIYIFVLISFNSSVYAKLSIFTDIKNNIILHGNSFSEINSELIDLLVWSHSENKLECDKSQIIQKNEGNYEVNISSCLPTHPIEFINKNPHYNGPNCFNLVLNYMDVTLGLYESDSAELESYLQSPLCTQLKKDESIQPGDIGLIKNGIGYIHGFIYGTKNIAYTKNGVSKESPYQLQPINEVFDLYHVGIKTSENNESECYKSTEPECQDIIESKVFRCKSFKDFAKSNHSLSKYSNNILYWLERISVLELPFRSAMFTAPDYLNKDKLVWQNHLNGKRILSDLQKSSPIISEDLNQYDKFLKKLILAKTNNFSYIFILPPLNDSESEWTDELNSKLQNHLDSIL